MLNRPSMFMLIRIFARKKFAFVLPISLWVINETLSSVADLVQVAEKFIPARAWAEPVSSEHTPKSCPRRPSLIINMCLGFMRELQRYGRLRMVEVATADVKVYIDLY